MEYLLILFIIAVILSPLAWFKSTPSQVRKTGFRQKASSLGLIVQLVPQIDAEESEKTPESVRYLKPFALSKADELRQKLGSWTLLKDNRRGWASPWNKWTWFRGEANESLHSTILTILDQLPDGCYGLRADKQGLSAYFNERGDIEAVSDIAKALNTFDL